MSRSPISTTSKPVRYIPYYPPLATRAVFPKERVINTDSVHLRCHRVFSLEASQKPAATPKPRVLRLSGESHQVDISKFLSSVPANSLFSPSFVAADNALIPKPPGEPGRSGNGTKQGFNLKAALGWNDFDQISKLIDDFVSAHFDPDLPLSNQAEAKIAVVETMAHAAVPRLRFYKDDWALRCMIQRAVKLSKTKRKSGKAEGKVRDDAESDLTDIENENAVEKTKPVTKGRVKTNKSTKV